MKKIKVDLKERSYNIFVGNGIIKDIRKLVPANLLKNPILIVTNKKIRRLAGKPLTEALKNINSQAYFIDLPDSEKAKSFFWYTKIIRKLLEIGKKRIPTLIALGGGVVGDVAGFAAATYRRGIPYLQIPTTFLAQVDSSIGGKVAIDMPEAKNIVGSFYQPKAVISDISLLKTLPKKEIRNGLAEVIKYGIILDSVFFGFLEKNIDEILSLKSDVLEYPVYKSALWKSRVVSRDEFDVLDKRIILNFGHTFAHAIESSSKYSKCHTHGESVGIGMVMASALSLKKGKFQIKSIKRIISLLKKADMPTWTKKTDNSGILRAMQYDKKFVSGKTRFVIPERIGHVSIVENIKEKTVKDILMKGVVYG